jgi:hypothetical protein
MVLNWRSQWAIEPCELHRVYPPLADDTGTGNGSLVPPAGAYVSVVHGDSPPSPIELSATLLVRADEVID